MIFLEDDARRQNLAGTRRAHTSPGIPVENARHSGRRKGAADPLASSRAMVCSCGMPSPSQDAGLDWDALRTAESAHVCTILDFPPISHGIFL